MLNAKLGWKDSLYLQTFPAPFLRKMRLALPWNDLFYKLMANWWQNKYELKYKHKLTCKQDTLQRIKQTHLPTKLTVVNFAGSRVRYDLEIVPICGEIAGSEGIGFLVFAGKGAIVYVTFAADFAASDENFEAGITFALQSSFSVGLGIFCASGRVKIRGLRSIGWASWLEESSSSVWSTRPRGVSPRRSRDR